MQERTHLGLLGHRHLHLVLFRAHLVISASEAGPLMQQLHTNAGDRKKRGLWVLRWGSLESRWQCLPRVLCCLLTPQAGSPGPADIQSSLQQPCLEGTSLRVRAQEVACLLGQGQAALVALAHLPPPPLAGLVSELAALGYSGPPAPPLSQPRAFDFFADCLLWLCQRCVGRLRGADRICKFRA